MTALYDTAVDLEKYNNQKTNREQTIENSITEATLIPWIAGLSGPILECST